MSHKLHLFEEVEIRPADDKGFLPIFQSDSASTGVGSAHRIDLGNINDGPAVDAPVFAGIQLADQLFDGLLDQRLAVSGYHPGVLVLGLKEADIFHGYEPEAISMLDADPPEEFLPPGAL